MMGLYSSCENGEQGSPTTTTATRAECHDISMEELEEGNRTSTIWLTTNTMMPL